MNRLFTRAAKALGWIHRHPTDAQENGGACILCGSEFRRPDDDYRRPYGYIGLRHRVYACKHACTLEVIDDVITLFRSAIPGRQQVWNWHLGVDDGDYHDPEITAWLDAQPHQAVEIVHPGGILTTRPLPEEYAGLIAWQAQRLGFTAMVNEGVAR